jgi:dTDP-4-dehydrorhamnose reductase
MKILLTGRDGQLGAELESSLSRIGNLLAVNRHELDLSKPENIRRIIREVCPRFIVNAAAYTDVARAEADGRQARAINAQAPAVMAEEGKKIDATLIHFSTDYVFDGTKDSPYEEDDIPNPLNVYGETKLAGERAVRESGVAHLMFRTTWVYGTRGRNFLLTILRLATEREQLTVINDQVGAPTWSREIAAATTEILAKVAGSEPGSVGQFSGTYHMSAAGQTSWFDFARAILEEASAAGDELDWLRASTKGLPLIARQVVPITSDQFPTPARRPSYSILSNSRLKRVFSVELSPWRNQLRRAFTLDSTDRDRIL